jgi:hypothetical protein
VQILPDGEITLDLRRFARLIARCRQADSAFTVPVLAMRELRLIRKSTMRLGDDDGGATTVRALTGGDDEVYDLGGLEFAERLRVLREVLARHPPGP